MPPPIHPKPENILKRAQELIGVNQAPAALTLLHDHITSKRSRSAPIASLEPVIILLIELAIEQKKGKIAKEALYQYKNISQNTNIATIEHVLSHFLKLAGEKVTNAQAEADKVQATLDTDGVEDLEASETPESILLATVSGDQSRDRTDRAIVTPWLKFLWEAFRTVLDILRNNARLEVLYQTTTQQAFDFCLKYTRKTEFRRLCELLRNHVQTAAKYSTQMHAINLNVPETLQRHLETRFQQLNVAVELELWQEAFRSVEDIHTLVSLSKLPPKNVMMANYYENLTRMFLVGENYLFHAAAWSRYYALLRQSATLVASGQAKKADNLAVSDADIERSASLVLLSVLSIPVISTTRSRGAMVDFDETKKNKNSRLTHLLGMTQAPTRASLFREAHSLHLLKRARPEIRELYNILEVDLHPLSICEKTAPILAKIGQDEEMAKYIAPLQQVILTRLFQQLSQVYDTVDLDFVQRLAKFPEPFEVTRSTIEKFIMNGNKKGDLAIRMDHATGVLNFDNDVFSSARAGQSGSADSETNSVQRLQNTPSDIVRSQFTRLARSLYTGCFFIDPAFGQAQVDAQKAALQRAREGAEAETRSALERKDIIQRRQVKASEEQARREKEAALLKRKREQEIMEAESRRLAQEQKEREERRIKTERDRIRKEELKKQLAELDMDQLPPGFDLDNLDNIDGNKLRRLKVEQIERKRTDISEKLRATAKRLDHLERAFRLEEAKKLPEDYARQIELDRAAHERESAETLADAKEKHATAVELKHRLSRLIPQYENFRKSVQERRHDEFERRRRDAERELEKQISLRKKEFRERKLREKLEREEKERQLREAEERAAKEAEEKKAREEARREEVERLRAEKEVERQEMLERYARQLQREEDALARRQHGDLSKQSPASGDIPAASSSSGQRRPLNLPPVSAERKAQAAASTEHKLPEISATGWRPRNAGTRGTSERSAPERPAPERSAPPARTSESGDNWRGSSESSSRPNPFGSAGPARNTPPPRAPEPKPQASSEKQESKDPFDGLKRSSGRYVPPARRQGN